MDSLISAKFTSKTTGTHLKYLLSFSAIDEATAYITLTEHLISQKKKKTVQRIVGEFVNKTPNFSHQKNL